VTKTIPSQYKAPGSRNFTPGEPIEDEEWGDLIQAGHYLWSRQISHHGGVYFRPAYQTNQTSLGQTPTTNSMRSLDDVHFGGIARHIDRNGDISLTCEIIGANIKVEFDIRNETTNTQLDTLTLEATSSSRSRIQKSTALDVSKVSSGSAPNYDFETIGYRLRAATLDANDHELVLASAYEGTQTSQQVTQDLVIPQVSTIVVDS